MNEQAFKFYNSLPLGKDETNYKKLSGKFVDVEHFHDTEIINLNVEGLSLLAAEAFRDINHFLRPTHVAQLRSILDDSQASDND